MKAWQIRGEYGIDNLKLVDVPEPKAGAGEVVVALRSASLNFRDLATIRAFLRIGEDGPLDPLVLCSSIPNRYPSATPARRWNRHFSAVWRSLG